MATPQATFPGRNAAATSTAAAAAVKVGKKRKADAMSCGSSSASSRGTHAKNATRTSVACLHADCPDVFENNVDLEEHISEAHKWPPHDVKFNAARNEVYVCRFPDCNRETTDKKVRVILSQFFKQNQVYL
jgi:hypothetical protein